MQLLTKRDICRLSYDRRLSNREIGRLAKVSSTTVGKYRSLLASAGISRERLDLLSDSDLHAAIQAQHKGNTKRFFEPNWDQVYQDYQKRDVTISLLYAEYLESAQPTAEEAVRSESSFSRKLREYCEARGLTMRQPHLPGQEMFVDFSGKHLYWTDPRTGVRHAAELFVAVLGASQLLFVTAVPSQKKGDWIEANIRALEYFGGVPVMVIPDNLKSAVVKTGGKGRDPIINRSYVDFSDHYNTIIVPARPECPQDKALAEIGVRITNIWVIARLRNHIFHSCAEINQAIAPLNEIINNKKSRRLMGKCRRERFAEIEAAHLQALPSQRHEYAEWAHGFRVPKDYHVAYRGDFYSVPHRLVGQTVDYCVSRTTLKIFTPSSAAPVAVHLLGNGAGQTITSREHMPEAHQMYHARNVDDLLEWGKDVGPEVREFFDCIIANKHIKPIFAIRQMSRAQKLAKDFGHDRLRAVCKRANAVGICAVDSIHNMLKNEIDLRPPSGEPKIAARPIPHNNVRGGAAYSGE